MRNESKEPIEVIKEVGRNACNLTLLAGLSAALGYIAGILSAPKAGKELRREVEEKSNQFIDKAKQQIVQLNRRLHPEADSYDSQVAMNH